MRTIKLCVLLATMFLLVHAQTVSNDSNKARVLSLENAWNEAENHKDAKALQALLDDAFVYTESDGSFSNRQQFLASVTDPSYRPEKIVNESMSAHAYDNVVVVTGIYREQGTDKGKFYSRRGRFTDTWILQNGAWLCAASQETLISH